MGSARLWYRFGRMRLRLLLLLLERTTEGVLDGSRFQLRTVEELARYVEGARTGWGEWDDADEEMNALLAAHEDDGEFEG